MPRVTTVQAAHSYGVLDPLVIERRDTKFVGGSLSDGRNIILLPQGGYTDRGGTTDFGRVRRNLTQSGIEASMLSLPNGGTAGDLLAGATVTTGQVAGARYVLFECNFSAARLLHFIDIKDLSISTTPAEASLVAEYWNGAAWVAFGPPQRITIGAYSRRFACGAPGHAGIAATRFRVAIDATTGAAGAVSFSGVALWAENATGVASGIVRRYAPEQGQAHQLVITAGNIDVYERGIWCGAAPAPWDQSIIREIKFEARYDTILAFHNSMRPQKITRLENSAEWACDGVVFENMPRVDYGGQYTNGVNEVQEIRFYSVEDGKQFELTFEGQTTTAITKSSVTPPLTAERIRTALEDLPNIGHGLTVIRIDANLFHVEFSDDINRNKNVLQMTATNLSDLENYVQVSTITQGKAGGEDLLSDARGWPAVGRFAQQRLIMVGLKFRPNDMLASVLGDPYNLNTELALSSAAFSYEVDAPENKAIRDIIASRTLLFFGDQQVVFTKNAVLSAQDVPQFGLSDAPGIKAVASPISSDNAIFYLGDDGPLRMINWNEIEQNFIGDNASVLSAHLIRDPIDMARRRATPDVDADLLIMVNVDGTITVLTIMRTQEVSGFAPWSTDGAFRSVCVDHDNETWFLVERSVNGSSELRLEKMAPDKLLDEAVEIQLDAPSSVITDLSRFNGRQVYATANNSVYGPYTASGGQIDIEEPATFVRIGTWLAPVATDPSVSFEEETRARHARLKRINRAEISLFKTTSLAIQVNDGDIVNLALRSNADTITDEGPLVRPVTGRIEAEGMHGFTTHGQLTVTQAFPGYLTVRSVTKNVVA